VAEKPGSESGDGTPQAAPSVEPPSRAASEESCAPIVARGLDLRLKVAAVGAVVLLVLFWLLRAAGSR
jgi:hypothetical protein